MTRNCCSIAVALALLSVSNPAAQGTSDQIARLVRTGQQVVVVDDEGRDLDGRITSVGDGSFDLIVDDRPVRVNFDRVIKIDHPPDGLGNGAVIGMVTFVGLTWLGQVVDDRSCAPNAHCPGVSLPVKLWATGAMAAFGAGIGVGIDALIQRRDRAIYRRGPATSRSARATIAPAIGPGVRGAMVSVTW